MPPLIRFALGVLLILGCAGLPAPAEPPDPAPAAPVGPSFLVIVADDLGTDKVAAYREHPRVPPSPNLDRLASEGVLFRNAYTYPTCSASRAALLTGRYGRRNGMGAIVELHQSTHELPLAEVSIPEALGDGWRAAALGKWHLSGFRTPSAFRHPLLQGFDHHVGSLGNLVSSHEDGQPGSYARYEKNVDGEPQWSATYATVDTTDDAIHQLQTLSEPWFLWVGYNAPHDPFHAPPAELVRERPSPDAPDDVLYGAMVEALDHEVGRLIGALSAEQRARTWIVFVGDNGTAREAILPPRDPKHGKTHLYEGGTNVPLIVAGPGVPAGAEAGALVHAVDLLPTVLELAERPRPDRALDGVSFASVLADPTSPGLRQTVYTERFAPIGAGPYDIDLVAVRDDRYKILRTRKGEILFFDLQGRHDDGPPRTPKGGPERERHDRLLAELDRITNTVKYEY